ncbi:hypothetical protein FKX85_00455 [Echinicola soli]|uniref:Uncharacterized protein n=1 Tax=Echinicola soli TaxID=2591634 RepID=A0A514CCQ4_9BACT|nr:hypothetical protein [Echinicola soli]QDH77591.1 hypothetical protein FKX85_00455 [Echinicola soli]
MKKSSISIIFLGVFLLFQSCSPSPRKSVEVAVTHTNIVSTGYSEQYFLELKQLKEQDRIKVYKDGGYKKVSVEEYMEEYLFDRIQESYDRVKGFAVGSETREMLAASLEVLKYGKTIFESEYPVIAKMMDENRPSEEIDRAIQGVFDAHDVEMARRFDALYDLAIPYAEKHDVALQID